MGKSTLVDVDQLQISGSDSQAIVSGGSSKLTTATWLTLWDGASLAIEGGASVESSQIGLQNHGEEEVCDIASLVEVRGKGTRWLIHVINDEEPRFDIGSRLCHAGEVVVADSAVVDAECAIYAGSYFGNGGNTGGRGEIRVENHATLRATEGVFLANNGLGKSAGAGLLMLEDGALVEAPTVTLGVGGVLAGEGSVQGDIDTRGLVAPGAPTGWLSVEGDGLWRAGSVTRFALAGETAGADYPVLQLSGGATLDGTLEIVLADEYQPNVNSVFHVLKYGNRSGQFSALDAPALPFGWQWLVEYGADTLTVRITGETCYPDLDGNGTLDLFDFLAFVNLFNVADPAADCTGDGVFDLFDFLCFVNTFNEGC